MSEKKDRKSKSAQTTLRKIPIPIASADESSEGIAEPTLSTNDQSSDVLDSTDDSPTRGLTVSPSIPMISPSSYDMTPWSLIDKYLSRGSALIYCAILLVILLAVCVYIYLTHFLPPKVDGIDWSGFFYAICIPSVLFGAVMLVILVGSIVQAYRANHGHIKRKRF